MVSIAVLIAALSSNCGKGETDGPDDGGGGAGLWAPVRGSGVICGGKECPADKCRTNIRCTEYDECTGDRAAGWEDFDACTVDVCDPETGESTHTPIPKSEWDDGDPCTEDFCWSTEGVVHQNICEDA